MSKRNRKYVYHFPNKERMGEAIRLFAQLEAEIATYHLPLPPPWLWAIHTDGSVDIALRLQQLSELLTRLRKEHSQTKEK